MTTNVTATERVRRRYGRVRNGLFAVGIVGFLLGLVFEYALIGSVIYLLGIVGGLGGGAYVRRTSTVTVRDERDERFAERTSYLAWKVVMAVFLAVFPVLFVLDNAGVFEFSPVLAGVLYAVSAQGLLWGGCCLAAKYVL